MSCWYCRLGLVARSARLLPRPLAFHPSFHCFISGPFTRYAGPFHHRSPSHPWNHPSSFGPLGFLTSVLWDPKRRIGPILGQRASLSLVAWNWVNTASSCWRYAAELRLSVNLLVREQCEVKSVPFGHLFCVVTRLWSNPLLLIYRRHVGINDKCR